MTKIEWVKNPDSSQGITVNSKTGCRNHTPEGLCLGGLFPCYAWKLAHSRLRIRYQANWNFPPSTMVQQDFDVHKAIGDTFYPRWWPEHLDKIRGLKKPTGIFLDDMSDWMWDGWPEEWTRQELQVMRDCPQHRFYTLTKQPQRLPEFSPFPNNCFIGVTITNQNPLSDSLRALIDVEAKTKFLSFEPLLGEINVSFYPDEIQGLIIGACTGTYSELWHLAERLPLEDAGFVRAMRIKELSRGKYTLQPKIEWVREIVEAAGKAGIRVFLKDNLRPLLIPEDCSELNYLTEDIFWASEKAQLRQEMPELK